MIPRFALVNSYTTYIAFSVHIYENPQHYVLD